MIIATVGDLLDYTLWDIAQKHAQSHWPDIYVVRDNDVVFYVGQSDNPMERLLGHVGLGSWGWSGYSDLGRTIDDNLPEARSWTIELWTVQECKDALADETTSCCRWDKDDAEQAMIRDRRPYLNHAYNETRRQLPDRYRKPQDRNGAGAMRATRAVFGITD